ncbi:MAG: hypothetical protein QXN05_05125 [Acidilobaceae archaeon]
MSERVPAGGIYRAISGMHESLTLDNVKEARRTLSIYCRQLDEFCENYVSLVSKAAEKTAKIRVEDLMESKDYKGLDQQLFDILKKVLNVYSKYIAGFLVTWNELVVVQFLTDVKIRGRTFEKGEVALLPLHEAAVLSVTDIVKVFESIALVEQRKEKT